MKKSDEQIFIGIWKVARKEAKKASQTTIKSNSIEIKRKSETIDFGSIDWSNVSI